MVRIGLGVACIIVEIEGLLDGCCGIALRILTMVGSDDKDEEVRAERANEPIKEEKRYCQNALPSVLS